MKAALQFTAVVLLVGGTAAVLHGQSADSFDPNANGSVRIVVIQPDGKILLGGEFTTLSPNGGVAVTRNRIARLNPNGTLDTAFNPNADRPVDSIAVQVDAKILVGGEFNHIGGQPRNYIARLDAATGLADSFDPNGGYVLSLAVQPDGKILATGTFDSIGGQPRNNIARLDPTNGLADSFNPNANSIVRSMAVQPDGKILVGGAFNGPSSIGVQTRNYIARLDAITGLADSFNPNANNEVLSLAVQPDGKILAGGIFSSIGGQPRACIARLDAITGLADSFDPNTSGALGYVNSIVVQPDGKILVGGFFNGVNSMGGQTRNRIARLYATTGLADSFDPNANNEVLSLAVQPDGKILAGGRFTSIGGQTRNSIARIIETPFCDLMEAFEDTTTPVPTGWFMRNNSQPGPGSTGWFQGSTALFPSQSGASNSYIAADYDNGTGTSTLSNWLFTPPLNLQNGGQLTFWTRTVNSPVYADRLQVRMSTNGASLNVGTTATSLGDFTTLLLDINPTYALTSYPNSWTQFTVTLSGLASPTVGRLAFRYFVEDGGPTGTNSDYIGIDTVQYACNAPTPTPTPMPTPMPITISGTIPYCPNPIPGPVPNVTLSLTGSASGLTMSDSSGNYQFSLASGGTYTVTPTKTARLPGSAGINTVDVIAVQRHYTSCASRPETCLSGCSLTAADVNGDTNVTTIDVIAIQRFSLGITTGFANVGKYRFNPTSRTYTGLASDQTNQNYDTLIFGDVASHFAE